jgi:hypothetical protein
MRNILLALVMFALTAYCVMLSRDGFRSGRMPLFFGHIWSIAFDRDRAPPLFWGAVAFNLVITAIMAAGGIILLIGAAMQL